MIEIREFLMRAKLDDSVLQRCIEEGWLTPQHQAETAYFSEADVARVQFIQEMRTDFRINDEGIGVILDLLDQVHGLRRTLRELAAALAEQPDTTRSRITAVLRSRSTDTE